MGEGCLRVNWLLLVPEDAAPRPGEQGRNPVLQMVKQAGDSRRTGPAWDRAELQPDVLECAS